jgi:hypothetical protein
MGAASATNEDLLEARRRMQAAAVPAGPATVQAETPQLPLPSSTPKPKNGKAKASDAAPSTAVSWRLGARFILTDRNKVEGNARLDFDAALTVELRAESDDSAAFYATTRKAKEEMVIGPLAKIQADFKEHPAYKKYEDLNARLAAEKQLLAKTRADSAEALTRASKALESGKDPTEAEDVHRRAMVELPIQENRVKTLEGLVKKAHADAELELTDLVWTARSRMVEDLEARKKVSAKKMFAGIRENMTDIAALNTALAVLGNCSKASVLESYMTVSIPAGQVWIPRQAPAAVDQCHALPALPAAAA